MWFPFTSLLSAVAGCRCCRLFVVVVVVVDVDFDVVVVDVFVVVVVVVVVVCLLVAAAAAAAAAVVVDVAVAALQASLESQCISTSSKTFGIWFSFDGLLEPEEWALQSEWLHERPRLRRSMHWRFPLSDGSRRPCIHHPLTLLRCDVYAESVDQTYDAVLGGGEGGGGGDARGGAPATSSLSGGTAGTVVVAMAAPPTAVLRTEAFARLAECAKMLYQTTASFARGFGRPIPIAGGAGSASALAAAGAGAFGSSPRRGGGDGGTGADINANRAMAAAQQEQEWLLAGFARDVHELLLMGLAMPQLRDEIYVHILKELSVPVADSTSGSECVA